MLSQQLKDAFEKDITNLCNKCQHQKEYMYALQGLLFEGLNALPTVKVILRQLEEREEKNTYYKLLSIWNMNPEEKAVIK